MENLDYNNENTERKYLGKNQFFKLKHSLSDLEKDFMELKDRELKDREEKIKREIKELFYKPIIVCEDDMDKFEKQVLMKSLSHLIQVNKEIQKHQVNLKNKDDAFNMLQLLH